MRYHKNFFSALSFILLLIGGACEKSMDKADEIAQYVSDLPFDMPSVVPPEFPEYEVNIKDFGAEANSGLDNTEPINNAIRACAKAGGGKVIVPPGIWTTGPIRLESNINLHVEKGAIVSFSPKFENYPLIETSWEGLPAVRCTSPISGKNLENIAITGSGIIDGAGDRWRPVLKYEMTELEWEKLVQSGGVVREGFGTMVWWPSENAANGEGLVKSLEENPNPSLKDYTMAGEYLRPVLVSLVACKNILLDGPTFQNSPAWNIHPLLCENMIIRNVKVRNPWYSTNGDGLDIESCKNVLVYDSMFDVGDDAICIKSGKNEYGRKRGIPSENIVVNNCTVYHGHGGVTLGSEMSGGVRNVSVKNCQFMGTEVGLRFKSTRGRGGVVENIFMSDILMENIKTDAIRFNMFYDNKAASIDEWAEEMNHENSHILDEGTPQFKNIFVDKIICHGAGRAIFLRGLPEMPIRKIEISNAHITSSLGVTSIDGEDITFRNVDIEPRNGASYFLHNTKNVVIEGQGLTKHLPLNPFLRLSGQYTDSILLEGFDDSSIKKSVLLDPEVKAGAIVH
jgi:polygalacturonase